MKQTNRPGPTLSWKHVRAVAWMSQHKPQRLTALTIIASMLIRKSVGSKPQLYPLALITAADSERTKTVAGWVMTLCIIAIMAFQAMLLVLCFRSGQREAVGWLMGAIIVSAMFCIFGHFMLRICSIIPFYDDAGRDEDSQGAHRMMIQQFAHVHFLLSTLERMDAESMSRITDDTSLRRELEAMFKKIANMAKEELKQDISTSRELLGRLIDIAVMLGIYADDDPSSIEAATPSSICKYLYTRAFGNEESTTQDPAPAPVPAGA